MRLWRTFYFCLRQHSQEIGALVHESMQTLLYALTIFNTLNFMAFLKPVLVGNCRVLNF
ncbi:hypothetical protein MNBD_ALPHA11-1843 [hydrothermal vent metagenome]|uniref:Uncharacterized protein n=1 Tax=hydrothermal vent metagenome TaxID=652676 RepID=A0A3B0UG48_9ZZZZ